MRDDHESVLDALGPRIAILGPSNSGKSTLACAISRVTGLPVVHLDQLYHLPRTDWVPRPSDEFTALHETAIADAHWVMEGNYTRLLSRRLDRATGVILLDVPTSVSLYRYVRRCWFERERRGGLEGGLDSVKWDMIRHITTVTRSNRIRYRQMFEDIRQPKLVLNSTKALARFYHANTLSR